MKHCVFPMFGGSGGSKSRPAKAAGAEPSGGMRDPTKHLCLLDVEVLKRCTPLRREARSQVNSVQN